MSKAQVIKKMVISSRNDEAKLIPIRSINITAEFIGIGTNGQVIVSEFSALAETLEPTIPRRSIVIMDV